MKKIISIKQKKRRRLNGVTRLWYLVHMAFLTLADSAVYNIDIISHEKIFCQYATGSVFLRVDI